MAEFGSNLGLSFRTNAAAQIDDIKYFDRLQKENQAMNAAKTKMLLDDIDFQNGSNPYDSALIGQENKKLVADIGKFTRDNPDWMTNVDKAAQLKLMKQSIKSSPAVLRSVAYKDAISKMNTDLADAAKNPNSHDEEAYQDLIRQRENYDKYGNQYGMEAAQKEGPRPFVYTRPKDLINIPDTLLKAGKNLNNFNVKKGKVLGEYMTEPKPEEVKAIKDSLYQEHSRSIQLQARKLGLNTPEQVDKWLTDGIVAGFEPKYSPGDPTFLYEYGLKKRELMMKEDKGKPMPGYSPFDDLFDKRKPAGNVPSDIAYKVWGETPKIQVVGNSGQAVNLTGLKMNYDNRYITDSRGRRYLTGYVNVPLDVAKQNGIWTGDDEDGGISAAFLGKGVRRQKESKDGKGTTYVKLDYQLPIDHNDGTARQFYDTWSQPDKLVPALQYDSNLGGGQSKPDIIQGGFTYRWNSQTNSYE